MESVPAETPASSAPRPPLRGALAALVGSPLGRGLAGLALFAGSARRHPMATTLARPRFHSLWATETTRQMHQDLDAAEHGAN